ncbi:glycine cleavage system protein GcvH [Salicibibacter halophilus]|uniref:Glycine cleavage system H protein n=1 Tax=Salicibibacter halophilus TaxID=2502791 RepID=A0A514LGX6_9BACI|nr:glycine cleavage system protein GcvH [Salicibibacter halophilus]QDI91107.1 glycine cleavage system protein GcvH [Salicibibacter halophilus]
MGKLYSKDHEWVETLDDYIVRIGISNYAQQELGDIVFVEIPEVDDEVTANESIGSIESVKTVSEIYVPISGTVVNVNERLEDEPELVNDNPEGKGWLIEVKMADRDGLEDLMSETGYQDFTKED